MIGQGLGASSAFSRMAAGVCSIASPDLAGSLKYFSNYFSQGSPFHDWIIFEVIGLFCGAVAGAALGRTFGLQFDRGKNMGIGMRVFTAFSGGILIGFASRLSRGCTSGVGLTGGAQLALGGWLFIVSMFIAGFLAAALFRRLWS